MKETFDSCDPSKSEQKHRHAPLVPSRRRGLEIAPAKTGLAAASTWWAAFFRWARRARGLRLLGVGRGGATHQKQSREIVQYFAVGGLAVTASGGLRRLGLNAHQVPVHRAPEGDSGPGVKQWSVAP